MNFPNERPRFLRPGTWNIFIFTSSQQKLIPISVYSNRRISVPFDPREKQTDLARDGEKDQLRSGPAHELRVQPLQPPLARRPASETADIPIQKPHFVFVGKVPDGHPRRRNRIRKVYASSSGMWFNHHRFWYMYWLFSMIFKFFVWIFRLISTSAI